MEKNTRRSIAISALVLSLMFFNFSRLVNSECIRAIHIVTLMIAGAAAYVLLVNIAG
ncbi:MAG: hypothetical protein ABIQ56_07650 [Chitinophagaceae bacterium]